MADVRFGHDAGYFVGRLMGRGMGGVHECVVQICMMMTRMTMVIAFVGFLGGELGMIDRLGGTREMLRAVALFLLRAQGKSSILNSFLETGIALLDSCRGSLVL
jgi:hypothetical protein